MATLRFVRRHRALSTHDVLRRSQNELRLFDVRIGLVSVRHTGEESTQLVLEHGSSESCRADRQSVCLHLPKRFGPFLDLPDLSPVEELIGDAELNASASAAL